jgi:nitroimidazol reductase NimA-like FMN-containing flavoprotein (pyridoxamine 5'-phosphate oxidase superfamily)
MDDNARIVSVLQDNLHMVLSTADENGKPWVTPVSYSFDEHNNLYWASAKDSRHSANIRARKEVAIVIYTTESTNDALYIEAEAQELVGDQEILSAIEVTHTREQPGKYRIRSIDDVSGESAWRLYKATPEATYVRSQSISGGKAVTVRRKIA